MKLWWCFMLTFFDRIGRLQDVVWRSGQCVTCIPKAPVVRRLSVSHHSTSRGAKDMANCIFCQICGDNPRGTELMFTSDDLVVFRDIKPAAKHHYLVVTREHICDAKNLTSEHKALLEKMIQTAKVVLEQQGCDMTDVRLGFHWPPFHSISHLHLHAISPASEMGIMARMIFKPHTWWFVTPEYVLSRL